jgi:hypothetical protein
MIVAERDADLWGDDGNANNTGAAGEVVGTYSIRSPLRIASPCGALLPYSPWAPSSSCKVHNVSRREQLTKRRRDASLHLTAEKLTEHD